MYHAERTSGIIVGFSTIGLALLLKSVFSWVKSPLFTLMLIGIVVGVPILLSLKKKPTLDTVQPRGQ